MIVTKKSKIVLISLQQLSSIVQLLLLICPMSLSVEFLSQLFKSSQRGSGMTEGD